MVEKQKDEYGSFDITINDKHYHFAPSWKHPVNSVAFFGLTFAFVAVCILLLIGLVYGLMGLSTGMGMLLGQNVSFATLLSVDFFIGCFVTAGLGLLVYGILFSRNKVPKSDAATVTAEL